KKQVDEWIKVFRNAIRTRAKPPAHPGDRERAAEAIRTEGGIPPRRPG
ncbi:MAG: hypothetical protein QOF64_1050, partial [Candidatus Binatota bacterium]|nr:hypothetical protein [Candidatus Binatota bacterium]